MTYQGERARLMARESGRSFAVSKLRIGADGRASHVLWTEVDGKSGHDVGARVVAPVADVVEAIHEGAHVVALFSSAKGPLPRRMFVVVAYEDGSECIAFDGLPSPGRNLADVAKLDASARDEDTPARSTRRDAHATARVMSTFAVSKVRLDADGRVEAVVWGRVDTRKNAWAAPEVEAPVAEAVAALEAGDQVFALFPSAHGHMPDRRFVIADYDGGLKTIVLDGRATFEREIHDMDRMALARVA